MLRAKDLFCDLCEVVKVRFMGPPFLNVVLAVAVAVAVVLLLLLMVVVVVVVVACASRLRALEKKLFMLLFEGSFLNHQACTERGQRFCATVRSVQLL